MKFVEVVSYDKENYPFCGGERLCVIGKICQAALFHDRARMIVALYLVLQRRTTYYCASGTWSYLQVPEVTRGG